MRITDVNTYRIAVPLKKPFKTALRTVHTAEAVIVKITAENGIDGWGEAPPTAVITGETILSIEGAIRQLFTPVLIGQSLLNTEAIFVDIEKLIVGNRSAKAAINMAVYDCLSQMCGLPLYQFLGGYRHKLETNFTVSVNHLKEMGEDAVRLVKEGFHTLKVKVGKDDMETDISRIREIRQQVGPDIQIRLDANQGWTAKQAVTAIRKMEDEGFNIELVEQPVHKADLEGLKQVTNAVDTLIMADESVFTPEDAFQVLKSRGADLINIKLMKAGGIWQALKINKFAEVCGVECMVGSMIETRLGITAAAHFAASQKNVTRFDFDAPLMLSEDIVHGGISYKGSVITFPSASGLGIDDIRC
ncbi:dipeptide epimerase [Bacillus sp. WMMC1349]|uniref:mandelate racemase/muconate lactonizing enzyme family protein n=1 Tax=Bacillus sp. WMMC1349 TaxID=2736254 RepID=UPI00155323E0|nr:dipeptide epimerase [Bacillus sp. WMMC1349]NPC92271.1 dipeptide epimerase [Bacillus sp. WMMC1349]